MTAVKEAEASPSWQAEVIVLPKEGVNDPEGEAIFEGLHALGHVAVRQVRAGRVLYLIVHATDEESARTSVGHMCDQLLANPVIESYQISVAPAVSAPKANV
ncbi:MAG: phosphoribosylformylglycinamidine synthase subunit PurS [Thermomicrobiales bacterium]